MAIKEDALIVAGVALAGLAVVWYLKNKVGGAVSAVAPYVNPMDARNVAYSSTNSFLGLLAGNDKFDLGYKLYDWLPPETLQKGADLFNPAKDASIVQTAGRAVTTFGESIGSGAYDIEQAIKSWWAK
jgi:hypothetical protein